MKRFLLILLSFWISLSSLHAQNPGDLDLSFNADEVGNIFGANGRVEQLIVQDDGKIIVGGFFSEINGVLRNRIARLNEDGSLDDSFNPGVGVGGTLYSMAIQPDGKILIGGIFGSYGGVSINNFARINPDGTLDGIVH